MTAEPARASGHQMKATIKTPDADGVGSAVQRGVG
jgi:hypothetical protein